MPIKDIDKGWNNLARAAKRAHGYVLVGVQGTEASSQHEDDGVTVAEVATKNEFGDPAAHVPQRSFIRETVDLKQNELQRVAVGVGRAVLLDKMPLERGLALLGEKGVGVMKQRIDDGIEPPNAPSTIKRKGSSKPLIDKGQLKGSITYKVVA